MVRRSPQTLIPSSPGTTSSGAKAPATGRTWCVAPRKPLFLRRRAPRLPGPRRRRRAGCGASLPANPYSFVAEHHVFRGQGAGSGPDVVRRSPQTLIPSSPSTTSSGSKAPVAGRTWCVAPRKPLFFRRRAPRLPGPRRRRRAGRGAPRPANPYYFVVEHHVFRIKGAGGGADVVRRSPQTLILSSPSTTSSGAMALATGRTWCAAPRKPLFLRRRAPRLPGPWRRQRVGRGAPLPANPCSFIAGHHVFRVKGTGNRPDVVRRSPQTLIPSSPSTTSSGAKAPAAGRTWCVAPHKPLFLRRRAPRLPGPRRRRRAGRGASLPANPYSFVAEHHVFRVKGAGGGPDVVRRSPQTLIPSSPSTTSSGAKAPAAGRTWCVAPHKPLFLRRRAPRLPGPRRRPRTGKTAACRAAPRYETTCTGPRDGGPVQVVLFIIAIPTQRHRCTAGSRCPSGRSARRGPLAR